MSEVSSGRGEGVVEGRGEMGWSFCSSCAADVAYLGEAKSVQTDVPGTGRPAEIAGASGRVGSLGGFAEVGWARKGQEAGGDGQGIRLGDGAMRGRGGRGRVGGIGAPLIVDRMRDRVVAGLPVVRAWVSGEGVNGPHNQVRRIQRLSNVHEGELPEAGPPVARRERRSGALVGWGAGLPSFILSRERRISSVFLWLQWL